MILYFSATGNCKYAAVRIADATQDTIYSITDCVHKKQYQFADKTIGIISPTYDWGLPSIVKEFLQQVRLQADYIYFIATYGTTPGATGEMAKRALKETTIDAYYSIRMPDTWTPIFDLSTPEKVAAFTRTTETEIESIIRSINSRQKNKHMQPRTPYFFVNAVAQLIYNKSVRKTSHLFVEDSCIGCGLCAKKCPVQAIVMQDKRPVWIKESCVMCLGCLHRCPKFAIQYGKHTKRHGQYVNPHVKL